MTLRLSRELSPADRAAVSRLAAVDVRTVRRYLDGDPTQRPYTVNAIERALRKLGLVAKPAPRSESARVRTLDLPFGTAPRPKGGDEEDE